MKGITMFSVRRNNRVKAILTGAAALAIAAAVIPGQVASAASSGPKPTIVLVHGAWADGSSWSQEVVRLQADGYVVDVAPNLLLGLTADSGYLRDYLSKITGPIVLVGHSYAGEIITAASAGNPAIKALVYDDAYIPDVGQSAASLSGPQSALAASATNPALVFKLVPYPDAPTGGIDTYLLPSVFTKFAAGVSPAEQQILFASQTPTSTIALGEPLSTTPGWKTIPSWDLIGTQDQIIPLNQQLAMAYHAGSHITKVASGHLSLITHPWSVTNIIEQAAQAEG
jgi:pimeloyl-ACP methyl ester carboxylesterase